MRKNFIIFLLSIFSAVALIACGTNLFKEVVTKDSDRHKLEEAKVLIDDGNYAKAIEMLDGVKIDSNDKRMLQASAQLGAVGFGLWDVIMDAIEGDTFKSSNSSGVDFVFNTIGEAVLGEGDVRTTRLEALEQSVSLLLNAPEPNEDKVINLRCFLAGIMSFPIVTDGTQAINNVKTELAALDGQCSGGIDDLNQSMTALIEVQSDFSLILQASQGCSFLDHEGDGSLNAVEQKVSKLVDGADQGCSPTPDCGSSPACDALQNSCTQAITNDSDSTAGDGEISSCEMLQNCLDTSVCF